MARTEDSHVAKLSASQAAVPVTDPAETALPEPFPALGSAHSISLSSANPVKLALPQDPRRRRAVLLAVDNDVYVASSLENAQAAEGVTTSSMAFYLPKSVPLPVTTKAALWVSATTTGSSSRVSVLAEKDDE